MRLKNLGLFDADDPPVICVLPNDFDSEKDICIRVKERPWNWVIFTTQDVVVALATGDAELLRGTAYRVRTKIRDRAP